MYATYIMFKVLVILLFVFIIGLPILSYAQSKRNNDKDLINNAFYNWKLKQYKSGRYATEDNCNLEKVTTAGYKGPEAGISKEVTFHYSDINLDSIPDALITFSPYLCDGGLALSNTQVKLLILSKGDKYYVDDYFIANIEKKYKGWFLMDGVSNGKLFGRYNEGGRTAERIKPFTLSYKTKKITFNTQ